MATLYESYNTGDNSNIGMGGVVWRAQTFTPTIAHLITSIKLLAYRLGLPGTATVSIRATSGGAPTGIDLCSGTTSASTLTTDTAGEWREITLGAGALLTAGVKYAIVIAAPSGNLTTKILYLRIREPVGGYAGGSTYDSGDSGASWTAHPEDEDYMFEDWGTSGAPEVATDPATLIGTTTVTLNGTLTDRGGSACSCSFEYGETTDYGKTTAAQSKATGESFAQEVRGLKSGTVYHFRAKATNSQGTSYGSDRTFHMEALSSAAHEALGKGYALGRHGV